MLAIHLLCWRLHPGALLDIGLLDLGLGTVLANLEQPTNHAENHTTGRLPCT